LFENIAGIEKGFRVLGAPAGVSRQPGLYLARVALSLGLKPEASGKEIVEALVAARQIPGIAPKRVQASPCKQNIWVGADVDLLRFPTPLVHAGDGGRYFGTWATVVAQTPDKRWTNWGIARVMLLDRNRLTGIVHPLQHLGMIFGMWKQIGKPMPFAIFQGGPPFAPFVSGMPLPAHVSEVDYMGGYFSKPVEVVGCETVDLEVPATAEIVVEGHLSITETAEEGPMGEYAGYLWAGPGTQRPVYNVTAVTYRNDPILPVVAAGEPIEEDHTAQGLPSAAELLAEFRESGIPATLAWVPFESAQHWLVVTLPRAWRQQTGSTAEELCRRIGTHVFEKSKYGAVIPKVLVMNDDIDATNTAEVVWAFATRCHPGSGEIHFNKESTSPLVAFLKSSEKTAGSTCKVVYNCLPPEDWGDRLPVRTAFSHNYPKELQNKVIADWTSYGFPPPL
jgi:UbiD family decarboxylase